MYRFWNERYIEKEFAYGIQPNQFLSDSLGKLSTGKIIFPCEGEGRNAVFAAQKGWEVDAFDLSEEGQKKAKQLADQNMVHFNYQIADALTVEYPADTFDVAALIFAHFPPDSRKTIHQKVVKWLKPGGILILEAFHPLQIGNNSGGPKQTDMLYSEKMLAEDFKDLKTQLLVENKINLSEGKYHQGPANVIRYIGLKE